MHGPQLELTTPGPCGRRTARRAGTTGTRSIPPAPGPIYGARRRQDAPRTNGRTDSGADGRRRRTARSLARAVQPARAVTRKRPLGRGLIDTQTRTTRRYHFADSSPASKPGELGPTRSQPGCGRRRAASRPWRNGDSDPAGRPARGGCDSPTAAQNRASGGPRHRPGATASRTTPVAQPGRGRDSPPAAHPRAAASQPRSTRPLAQAGRNLPRRNGDSEHTGRQVGGGSDPPPAAQPQARGRRVTTAVNKTAGSGEPQPAPGATATRNTPAAQSESEEAATCRRRPNPGFPHARARRSSTRDTGTRTASRLAVEQTARRNFTVRSRTGAAHGTSARICRVHAA
jgi:hypothetical protein